MKIQNVNQLAQIIFILTAMFSTIAKADTYVTSKGAVFTQVEFGKFKRAWKAPDGNVWIDDKQIFPADNNARQPDQASEVTKTLATKRCEDIGAALPTFIQYEQLSSYFEFAFDGELTDQGRRDFYTLFQLGRFWTSSLDPLQATPAKTAYAVRGISEIYSAERGTDLGVRCIYNDKIPRITQLALDLPKK